MKIIKNNILNYNNYSMKNIIDNKKSDNILDNKNLDTAYKKIRNDTLNIFGPNAPKLVKDAWTKTLDETGIYDLGCDENGEDHITQMDILRVIIEEQTGSCDVLGNSVDSAIKTVKLALDMLNNPITASTDPQIIKRQEKEKEFYEKFLVNLNQR